MEFNTPYTRTKQQHSYLLKKDKHKGTQRTGGYFPKIRQPNKGSAEIWTHGPWMLNMLPAGTVSPLGSLGCALRAGDPRGQGECRSELRTEARTHSPLLVMPVESAWNLPLHLEVLCLNTNACQLHCRKQQRLMSQTSPLQASRYHTQRQKWIDFEVYLKVNQIAVYFSRKSSPYQTLNPTPHQRNNKPQYFVSAAMPKTVIRSEKKRRESWWQLRVSSQIRSPASVPRKAGDNTVSHL